jgi:hypothetical protein
MEATGHLHVPATLSPHLLGTGLYHYCTVINKQYIYFVFGSDPKQGTNFLRIFTTISLQSSSWCMDTSYPENLNFLFVRNVFKNRADIRRNIT